jgi:hypothetical protein
MTVFLDAAPCRAMMMDAVSSYETSISFYQTAGRSIQEDSHLHRLSVFEYMVIRRIYGPKWENVTGCRRKLYIEELHNLHSSSEIVTKIK